MFRESGESAEIEALAEQIIRLAASVSAAMCRWLLLVAQFDAREGHRLEGHPSCADWLAWSCAISPVTAREHVRVARWLAAHPPVADAFGKGRLSYSKVRALARLGPAADPAALVDLAEHATAAALERMVAGARRVTRAEAADRRESRRLDLFFDDDGTAVLRARLTPEDGELVMRALEHALAALDDGAEPEPSDTREEPGARHADALVWLADRALRAAPGDRTAGDRTQVVVHVDVATLSAADHGGTEPAADSAESRVCRLADGPALAAETVRRLACDASVVTAVHAGDDLLSVGRKTRSIPPAIRRALRRRDPVCAFPGCERRRWLDAHHIRHWAHGGQTSMENLVHLCHHHHALVHEHGYTLAGTPLDGLLFLRPNGTPIEAAPPLGMASGIRPAWLPAASDQAARPDWLDLRADPPRCGDAVLAAVGDPPALSGSSPAGTRS